MVALNRSPVVPGGEYQSVMMTPPNGSAEDSGMNAMVSSAPRQRNAFTPIPAPPPPPPWPSLLAPLPKLNRLPLSAPPMRFMDGSPGLPEPKPMKSAGVGLGFTPSPAQPATPSA